MGGDTVKTKSSFYKEFDLKKESSDFLSKNTEQFQEDAINKLSDWFNQKHKPYSGGVLAIPTGGGKTFVASRFLSLGPLSNGYKVLWLAHTHHLLEQAFTTVCEEIGHTNHSRDKISLRIVSGTKNHYKIRDIDKNDDIIFATLQTITRSYKKEFKHPTLEKFLESTDGKLFVVFDEAHHAPAYTYRQLILSLRERFQNMHILGMTATPTRTDVKKGISKTEKEKLERIKNFQDGRLKELFPQGNLYKISMHNLIALNILAKPIFEPPKYTNYEVELTDADLNKLKNNNKVPEHLITRLASDAPRSEFIADTYAQNRDRYDKTIIFADRREQCVQLCDYLKKKDVKAGYMFSQGREEGGSFQRTDEENRIVLDDFKNGNIDVIVNIRMLTEGTDVPKAKTVFLTRQTLSEILMTQMVGRALRGPKFGGKKNAFIVPFIDDWKHKILWVPPEIVKGEISVTPPPPPPPVVLEFVSIEAIKKITSELYTGDFIFESYLTKFIPLGWYQTEFEGTEDSGDNTVNLRDLVMVFDNEKVYFEEFIQQLNHLDIKDYRKPETKFTHKKSELRSWYENFFNKKEAPDDNDLRNLFNITSHFAQNGVEPIFFEFENRELNDLDALVKNFSSMNLKMGVLIDKVKDEFQRSDRYWNSIYPNEDQFLKHFLIRLVASEKDEEKCKTDEIISADEFTEITEIEKLKNIDHIIRKEACTNLLIIGKDDELKDETIKALFDIARKDSNLEVRNSAQTTLDKVERRLLPEERREIIKRDGGACLCCGEENYLQIDHIKPRWVEINNSYSNLQTLCKFCNGLKGTKTINFLDNKTLLQKQPSETPSIKDIHYMDRHKDVTNLELWKKILKRQINFFYQCNAVKSVGIGKRGYNYLNWDIKLYPGNNPDWIKTHLDYLSKEILFMRERYNLRGPDKIKIVDY